MSDYKPVDHLPTDDEVEELEPVDPKPYVPIVRPDPDELEAEPVAEVEAAPPAAGGPSLPLAEAPAAEPPAAPEVAEPVADPPAALPPEV